MRTSSMRTSSMRAWLGVTFLTLASMGCPHRTGATAMEANTPSAPPAHQVLLDRWSGPYGGVPPLGQIKVAYFKPALEASMDANRKEIAAIVAQSAPPTFENTIAPLEDSGRSFNDVNTIFGIFSSAMSDEAFQAVEREMAPKLAAFADEIIQNAALFQRIEAVYDSPEKEKLTKEQQRLVWLYRTRFVLAGAKLDAEAKAKVAALNQRLATLYTEFSQAVLGDEEHYTVALETEADLAGLPDSVRAAAQAAAEARKVKALGLITNTRSSVEPFLTFSSRRDLREKVWRTFVKRGDNQDARDTKSRISEVLLARAQRAKLLGFPTHAHWRLVDKMAGTPERAMELLDAVWKPAVARVKEEVRDMQAVADKEGGHFAIAPWDYRYYAEKVRKAKYDLDQNEIKPYLQLEKLREALFYVAGELFGFSFRQVEGVPVYHPDVRVFEVVKRDTGAHVGLWYFDPYARAGKHSGAWMNAYRNQERFRGRSHHRLQQRQLRSGQAGRAGAHQLGRRAHAVPRIRPRAARAFEQRHLPIAVGHVGAHRLRGVPLSAARALARHQGGAEPLCAPREDGRADSRGAGATAREGEEVQPGLRHHRVPGERPGRHEAAPQG